MPTAEQYLEQGRQHHKKGDHQQAIKAYMQTLELDPSLITAAINLSNAFFAQKEYINSLLVWSVLKLTSKVSDFKKFIEPSIINALKECPDEFFAELHKETLPPKLLDSVDMNTIKQALLERLNGITELKTKLMAKTIALLPNAFTGSLFYHRRTLIAPSLKRGRLHLLAQSLEDEIKVNKNYLELPPELIQALLQQPEEWKNQLKNTFPVLHCFLLNPIETANQIPSDTLTVPVPIAYNPAVIPEPSAPLVTELSKPIRPFTGIDDLLHEANDLKADLTDIKKKYICPISQHIMRDPTVAADGYTYDRASIVARINSNNLSSPTTGEELLHLFLSPNQDYRKGILAYLEKKIHALSNVQTSQLLRASSSALFSNKAEDTIEPGSLEHETNILSTTISYQEKG